MRDKLRKRYQVDKEINRNGSFEGEIALSDLERLGELLYPGREANSHGKVNLEFAFSRNELGVPMISGQIRTRLDLECQRCLQALDWPLELDFRLMIDASDELVQNSSVDTLYSDEGFIDIVEVVEDELILAIPFVVMHEDTACNESWRPAESAPEPARQDNPFSVLQQLKTTD